MVLMSFSEEKHVPKLKSGEKGQTTRLQRKNPVKAGDVLHCYYKSRERKGCGNCIVDMNCRDSRAGDSICPRHTNFFGTATVTTVIPIKHALSAMGKEEFARKDGFDSWETADTWFRRNSTVGPYWDTLPYVVIQFEPHWLKEGDFQ